MLASLKPRPGKRWPRGQKFRLSPRGLEEVLAYHEGVRDARALGRSVLDAAGKAWAERLGVQAGDGVVLSELREGKRGVSDLAAALESCGTSAADVKAAIDRLVEAQLVEPVPLAAHAPTP